MEFEEVNKLSISDIKRRIKSRSGRIAELQVEVNILDMVLKDKVAKATISGLMGARKDVAEKSAAPSKPKDYIGKNIETERKIKEGNTEKPSKIKEQSSDHAFKEID